MAHGMKFWLSLTFEPLTDLLEHARVAEECGFEGVVLPDHIVLPLGPKTLHPSGMDQPAGMDFPDPFCAISAMATVTTRLRFMTYVYILPLRDPFSAAKQIGTAAELSHGRVVLGTGVGWLKEEFDIVGRDFSTRGTRTDEMLNIISQFLTTGQAELHGKHFDFPLSAIRPAPAQPVPIWVGGNADRSVRRAADHQGFMPMAELDDRVAAQFEEIDRLRAERGLDEPFDKVVLWFQGNQPALVREWAERGVTGLRLAPWVEADMSISATQKRDLLRRFADDVITQV